MELRRDRMVEEIDFEWEKNARMKYKFKRKRMLE